MKLNCIIKRPDEPYGHVTNISATLKNLQKTVGGYIECVTLTDFTITDEGAVTPVRLVIICDEEGRIKGKPHNCHVLGFDFCGDIIVIGAHGEDFADIPISFQQWKRMVQP